MIGSGNVFVWWAAALHVLFAAAAVVFPIEWLRIFSALLMLVSSLLVSSYWVPHGWMSFREGDTSKSNISLIAISMVMTAICMFSLYSSLFNVLGRPVHWSQWPVWQYIQIFMATALLMLCSNPGQKAPALSVPRLGFYVVLAVVFLFLGWALRDMGGDIAPVARWPL